MNRRAILASAMALTSCSAIEGEIIHEATVLGLSPEVVDDFFLIVRGCAEAAEILFPAISPVIALAMAAAAPAIANIEAGVATASDTATVLHQGVNILVAVAPHFKVTPTTPPEPSHA